MSRRLVYGTLGALVALALALGIGARQLAQREDGARLLAAALTRFYPQLSVEHRAGTLERAEFARILWEDAEVRVELRGIRWRLDPACLGWGKLCFEQLAIDSLEVRLPEGDTDDSPFALAPVRAPLPLEIEDGRLAVLRVLERGEEQARIEAITVAGDWRGSRVGIERAEARLGGLRAEASGTIALHGQLPLSAAGRVQWAARAPLAVSAKGDLGELALDVRGDATLPFEASGTVDALATPVALAFTARQQQPMPIELPGVGPLQFAAATLQGTGDLHHLVLELEGDIDSALLGANHLQASGSWGEAEALIEHATLSGALGELDGALRLERASGAWQASAALREACIPRWRADFECRMNGNVEARGRLAGGAERADARLALAGTVNGIPATVEGRARLDAAGQWRLEGVRLGSGANTLRLDGSAGERLAIDGVLELDRLADSWPEATGRGHGTLRIEGTLDAPALRATLDLERLESAGVHAGSVRLRADWQGAASAANSLAITLERGRFGDRPFARAELHLDGSRAAHALQATVSGNALALVLDCKGSGQDTGDWQGQCATLDAEAGTPESTWRLEQPLALQLREAALGVAPFCLRREASALCSEQRLRIARGGQIDGIRVRAGALPVAVLEDWLPEDLRAEGTMNFLLEATRPAGGPFRVQARLEAPTVSLHTLAAGEDLTLTLRELVATLASADDTTRLDWQAAVGDAGSTRGSLALKGATADATIDGRIELARIDVGPLLRESPGVLDARGTLDGEVVLVGRAEAPRMLGRMRLHEASLTHERLPRPLDEIELGLAFAGPRATITGQIGTGAGEIVIGGEANWNDTGWQADLDLHAESLALEPLRGSTLTVAPKLRVALRPQSASITGTLAIPSADLNLDAVPETAVRVSDDAVTVGAPPGEARFDYTLALDVRLGEAVRFRGLGADVRLGGQLQLERLAGSALQGTGELAVREGRYRAYGQRLEITEGQLLFRGPLDDPALRITAVRRIEDEPVTVGVRVRGDLRAPELGVFSRPAMAESRALHYLLTGRAPSIDDDTDMAGAGAMLQLGLAGANRVTGSVMSKLGIEDFEVSSRQLEDGQEVHLGGYLTPDLYLRYGVSTFDKVYTFRLRYRLRPQFFVEAISGIENAIDFLYSFER